MTSDGQRESPIHKALVAKLSSTESPSTEDHKRPVEGRGDHLSQALFTVTGGSR